MQYARIKAVVTHSENDDFSSPRNLSVIGPWDLSFEDDILHGKVSLTSSGATIGLTGISLSELRLVALKNNSATESITAAFETTTSAAALVTIPAGGIMSLVGVANTADLVLDTSSTSTISVDYLIIGG